MRETRDLEVPHHLLRVAVPEAKEEEVLKGRKGGGGGVAAQQCRGTCLLHTAALVFLMTASYVVL